MSQASGKHPGRGRGASRTRGGTGLAGDAGFVTLAADADPPDEQAPVVANDALVFAVGFGDAAEAVARRRVIAQPALPALREDARPGDVVLLGDAALAHYRPLRMATFAARTGCRVVAAPMTMSPLAAEEWAAVAGAVVLWPRDLRRWLAGLEDRRRRKREPPAWLPPVRDPVGARVVSHAVEAVASLERLTVKAWGSLIEWSRHRLRPLCLAAYGLNPSALLLRCIVHRVAAGRADGGTVDAVARECGYHGGSNLLRAYRRRGMRVPPRGLPRLRRPDIDGTPTATGSDEARIIPPPPASPHAPRAARRSCAAKRPDPAPP